MSNRHNYKSLSDLFARRAKDRNYKVMGNGWELHKNSTGQFVIGMQRVEYRYEFKGGHTGQYVKHELGFVCYLTISPDDVLEVVRDVDCADNSFKYMMGKFFDLWVWSEKKQRKHNLRWRDRSIHDDYPMHKGLKLRVTRNISIIHMEPDVVKATDRKAAKPVYEYTNKVIDMMLVLRRLDAFDDKKKLTWQERKNALSRVEVGDMSEDAIALLAEAAYWEAEMATGVVREGYWDYIQGKRVERDPAEAKAQYEKKLIANAKRRLNTMLKEKHGGFVEVTV